MKRQIWGTTNLINSFARYSIVVSIDITFFYLFIFACSLFSPLSLTSLSFFFLVVAFYTSNISHDFSLFFTNLKISLLFLFPTNNIGHYFFRLCINYSFFNFIFCLFIYLIIFYIPIPLRNFVWISFKQHFEPLHSAVGFL